MIYSPTVGLLQLCGIINLNYHLSLMFQIRERVHGPVVPKLFRGKAESCTDVINHIRIKLTSLGHMHATTQKQKHCSEDADL